MKDLKVVLACTGSVATIKVPLLVNMLLKQGLEKNHKFEVHLIVSDFAKHFFKREDIPSKVRVYDDDLAKHYWKRPGDPILHIELTNAADILVLAPLTASTMAKISHGIADNFVTLTARSWMRQKPMLFCPAMNPRMWTHPINMAHIDVLKKWGFIEIPPTSKTGMCGTKGTGPMAELDTIMDVITKVANKTVATRKA